MIKDKCDWFIIKMDILIVYFKKCFDWIKYLLDELNVFGL